MKEVSLYRKLARNKVQCQNCAHYCLIENGKRGKCGVRENRDGKLFSLVYGKVCALNIDPIEKKPLFHFLPGSKSLSLATVGCNFACKNCQNWTISQGPKIWGKIEGEKISAKKIVEIAKKNKLPSISYTYTEPAIFSDFALEIMKLAKKEGIKNVWVSNGFWSKELFEMISKFLDAVNIDLKSFEEKFYQQNCKAHLFPVLETLKKITKKKIWLEITTLIIPGLNDCSENLENIAKFIKDELGSFVPWHVTRFSGAISWKLQHLPDTPIEKVKTAWEIGKKIGLKYVYTGNIPGLESEDTFCPKCGKKVIERKGYFIKRLDKKGFCPKCGTKIDLIL